MRDDRRSNVGVESPDATGEDHAGKRRTDLSARSLRGRASDGTDEPGSAPGARPANGGADGREEAARAPGSPPAEGDAGP
jgi:hypothetical protein